MALTRQLTAIVLLTCLWSCIPNTTTTIGLGGGFEAKAIDQVDVVLEKTGYTRMYYESSSGGQLARIERDGKTLSGFARASEPGFGAGVSWRARDGALEVVFGERNTNFSARGKELLQNLINELRGEFGDRVAVVE